MAVKLIGVPGQIAVDGVDEILTEGVNCGDTTTAMALEVALAGTAQAAFENIVTVTISPLAKDELVNVGAFAPVLTLLTFH